MEDKAILGSSELSEFRKLGWANWFVRIMLALGVGALLYYLLPYGVSIIENTFQIVLGLTKTFLIGVPLFFAVSFLWANKSLLRKFRESLSRKLWEWFIYNDPLDYIKGVIEGFKSDYHKIQSAIGKLIEAAETLHDMANELIEEARGNMARAKTYMENEKDEQRANLWAYMSNKGMETTEDILAGYNEIMDSVEVMKELGESVLLRVEGMEFDLKIMNLNLKVSNAKRDAAYAAESVLNNTSMEAARLEFAKNAYKDKVVEGVAKFKQLMDRAKPILEADRIDKVIKTDKGREILKQFRENSDIGGLKSFEEQLEIFKAKNEIFSKTTAKDRVMTQRPEAIRTKSRFTSLS